jgi:hypothetical protein
MRMAFCWQEWMQKWDFLCGNDPHLGGVRVQLSLCAMGSTLS